MMKSINFWLCELVLISAPFMFIMVGAFQPIVFKQKNAIIANYKCMDRILRNKIQSSLSLSSSSNVRNSLPDIVIPNIFNFDIKEFSISNHKQKNQQHSSSSTDSFTGGTRERSLSVGTSIRMSLLSPPLFVYIPGILCHFIDIQRWRGAGISPPFITCPCINFEG